MQKVRGIVLKKILFQESDLIVKALLTNGEKATFFAKSALKSKKRFGGGLLDPLNYLEFQPGPKKTDSEIIFLNEAQMVYEFPLLKTDYDKIKLALYFLKVLNKVEISGLDDSSRVFDLLLHTLRSLEKCKKHSVLKAQFELKFLSLQGVLEMTPDLEIFVKSSLYDCDKISLGPSVEHVLRRSSFEVENFIEQVFEV
jgi:DNA repair protein RecO (recombination protein O)